MADSSKTEKATPKKRQEERKKGNIFTSRDVTSVVALLALFFSMRQMLPFIYSTLESFLRRYLSYAATIAVRQLNPAFVLIILREFLLGLLVLAMPFLLIAVGIGVFTTGIQTRFLFSPDALKFKFERMNPISGFKKLFSLRSVVEILKNLIKISIIVYLLYGFVIARIPLLAKLHQMDLLSGVKFMLSSVMDMVIRICLAFAVVAGADYFYQWWEYEKNLRMSKQEIKQEYKQQEGDPQLKGKIKEIQQSAARSRMMQAVPTADVVIKNPTHFAVALKYDQNKDEAPIVVAKGQDQVALKIIQLAEEHRVPVLENKPLARGLFAAADLGEQVPGEFYDLIAEVFAFVYSRKEKDKK